MQQIKSTIKRALGLHFDSGLKPLKYLKYVGSHLHGYFIPEHFLNEKSVCYCIGAGEDISFDTELVVKYHSRVFIYDPAPEGIAHFKLLKEATGNGEKISLGNPPFMYRISKEELNTVTYIETGVYDRETTIRFYKPTIENYASHSIELFNHSNEFIEVPVDRLTNLMKKNNHTSIDLVKMEIEGAEYAVLKSIAEDKPDIKMILVEFDEIFHPKDSRYLYRIKKASDQLFRAGYTLAHSTPYFKRLYIRNDIYMQLKSKEIQAKSADIY